MFNTLLRVAAVATLACLPFSANALPTPVTYDFKAAADGSLGESAYDTTNIFSTSLLGGLGPHLQVTATKLGSPAFVYLDAGNAGMGVCGKLLAGKTTGAKPNSTGNLCDPSSDDGLTTTSEVLKFTALSDMYIKSVDVNSNHDGGGIKSTIWSINNVSYNLSGPGYTKATDGDVTIALGDFFLAKNSFFTIHLTKSPNSYLSSMTVAAVPLPAAAWLLLGVAGALVAAKRRSSLRAA